MMEQFIYTLIAEETPVLLFEKDMSLKMLVTRLACRACGVPYWKISKGYATRTERDVLRETVAFFPKTKLRLQNPANLSADKFAAIVRRERRLHGIEAVFLDQIHHLDIGQADTVEGMTRASMRVKASAHETDIPHVALFAVNRNAPQGTRPRPEHVKGFDQLLSDVDGMAMLWTEQEKTALQKDQKLEMLFYAAKNRGGGETEESVWFDGPHLTFCNGEHDTAHLRTGETQTTRPVTAADFLTHVDENSTRRPQPTVRLLRDGHQYHHVFRHDPVSKRRVFPDARCRDRHRSQPLPALGAPRLAVAKAT